MEKFLGRFQSRSTFRDEPNQHTLMERELYPNADPGDPDAGERIDDEGETAAAVQAILAEAEAKLLKIGLAGSVTFTAQTADETPIASFKKASDKRWGIGNRRQATDAAVDTSPMSPIQKFMAASKRRWGY
jgi:hypothetical protein